MICFHLITFLTGFLITKSFLKEVENKFLIFSFAVAFGISIETFLIFLSMLFNLDSYIIFAATEIILVAAAVIISVRKKMQWFPKNNEKDKNIFLNIIFAIALLIGLIHVFYTIKSHPYGTWDAHYIWNLRPRFFIALQQIGQSWKIFFNNIGEWTHPDYPLLMPVYNYKNHILNGSYNPILNTATSFLILVAILSGVYGIVSEISGKNNALLAIIVLLTTECFMFLALSQCADIPLSLFILTAIASISLFVKYNNQTYIFFAYYFAASAMFCKNEGIMFFLIFTIISLIFIKKQNLKIIISGTLLPLLCLVLHKILLYSSCDLFEGQTIGIFLSRIVNIERYKTILSVVPRHFIDNFLPLIVLFFGVFITCFIKNDKVRILRGMYISIISLAMLGYFTIYLITPRDLLWHINTTDTRLIIHYIPLFIVFCFATFNCAGKSASVPDIENKNNND